MLSVILVFLLQCFAALADCQFEDACETVYCVVIDTITPKERREIYARLAHQQATIARQRSEAAATEAEIRELRKRSEYHNTVYMPIVDARRCYIDLRALLIAANRTVSVSVGQWAGWQLPNYARRLPVSVLTIPPRK